MRGGLYAFDAMEEVGSVGVPLGDLKALMGRHDITQRALGAEMGIGETYVSAVFTNATEVAASWMAAAERIAERRLEPVATPAEGAAA